MDDDWGLGGHSFTDIEQWARKRKDYPQALRRQLGRLAGRAHLNGRRKIEQSRTEAASAESGLVDRQTAPNPRGGRGRDAWRVKRGCRAVELLILAFVERNLGCGVSVAHVRPAPPDKTATKARQGETTGVVRWVLGISLTLAVIAMVIAFLVF